MVLVSTCKACLHHALFIHSTFVKHLCIRCEHQIRKEIEIVAQKPSLSLSLASVGFFHWGLQPNASSPLLVGVIKKHFVKQFETHSVVTQMQDGYHLRNGHSQPLGDGSRPLSGTHPVTLQQQSVPEYCTSSASREISQRRLFLFLDSCPDHFGRYPLVMGLSPGQSQVGP